MFQLLMAGVSAAAITAHLGGDVPPDPVGWTDVYSGTERTSSDGWANRNLRMPFDKSLFPNTTQQIRITLSAALSSTTTFIYEIYVGYQSTTGSPYDFESEPQLLTFNGSGVIRMVSGDQMTMDPLDLPMDGTKNLLIAMNCGSRQAMIDGTGVSMYRASGSIPTNAVVPGGSWDTETYRLAVSRIEASDDPWTEKVIPETHAFWRAQWLTSGHANYCTVAEMQLKEGPTEPNLAVGGTPLASGSYTTGLQPEFAFDGDINTSWESASQSLASGFNYLGYQFPTPVKIDSMTISVNSYETTERPRTGNVQFSDQGMVWTTAWSFDFVSWSGTTETKTVSNPEAFPPVIEWTSLYSIAPTSSITGQNGRTMRARISTSYMSARPRYIKIKLRAGAGGIVINKGSLGFGGAADYTMIGPPLPITFDGEASITVPADTDFWTDPIDTSTLGDMSAASRRLQLSLFIGSTGSLASASDTAKALTGTGAGDLVEQQSQTGITTHSSSNTIILEIQGTATM